MSLRVESHLTSTKAPYLSLIFNALIDLSPLRPLSTGEEGFHFFRLIL